MRIEQRDRRRPTVVRDAHDPDASVVVRDVLDQIIDRVVCVGALVRRLRIAFIARRTEHLENTLGICAAANILIDENVTVLYQLRSHAVHRLAGPPLNAIRCARHQYWERSGLLFGL